MTKWQGWIIGTEEDRTLLKRLGITISTSKYEIEGKIGFTVNEITKDILDKLNPYWGKLIWGLTPYINQEPIVSEDPVCECSRCGWKGSTEECNLQFTGYQGVVGTCPICGNTSLRWMIACQLCQDTKEVLSSRARVMGYTLTPGETVDEELIPCPACAEEDSPELEQVIQENADHARDQLLKD